MSTYKLTKSTYTYGRQCLKRLYLHHHHKKLGIQKDESSASLSSRLELGIRVGVLAQQVFPGGLNCYPEEGHGLAAAVALTSAAIANGHESVLYEASFQSSDVFVAMDILVRREDGWHGYEVKSTKKAESQHITDAALQYWVATRSGLQLRSMSIMHLNAEYKKEAGEINAHELFAVTDVTAAVTEEERQAAIEGQILEQIACIDIEDTIPNVRIGKQCSKPYPCDFMGHCWREAGVPEYSVLNLARGGDKSWKLFYEGVTRIENIDRCSTPLSPSQLLQVQCERDNKTHINIPEIQKFISTIEYPIYYLDFETIAPPVPVYEQSKCYQAIPFQYSLHVQADPFPALPPGAALSSVPPIADVPIADEEAVDGIRHMEFIGDGTETDPRRALLDRLLSDLGETGSIMVYNLSFESSRLAEMAHAFPEYADRISRVRWRLLDLAIPFQKKHYYKPSMRGKYSIKQVLPALCPEYAHSYQDLDVKEGLTASNTYLLMVLGQREGVEEKLSSLLAYCRLDTLAMVEILRHLYFVSMHEGVQLTPGAGGRRDGELEGVALNFND